MKYSENTLKYYENLKNIGEFDDKLPNVGTGIVGSPLCGDVMKVQLFFDNNNKIADAKYKVFGCVSAIASMELVSELLKGMSIEQALSIKNEDVANSLELSELKKHCSVLAKECIEAAVNDYKAKQTHDDKPIIISDKALKKLNELIAERKCLGINISVLSGGCSGIEYSLGYVDTELTDKCKIEVDKIKFYYDKDIELLIKGMQIDLMESSFGVGFTVINKTHSHCQNCTCNCK